MAETLDELVVKIRADASNLEKEMAQIKGKVSRWNKEYSDKLSFKAKFDSSIAVFRISELQKLREKLQREFDKKVSINVSSSSLDRTREKIAAVDARLRGVGESAQKTGGIFSSAFSKGLIMVGGITAFFGALKNSIQAAQESAIAHAKVSQAVRTTGQAAGLTAKELFGLADELKKITAIDDDTILTNITNNLLTFRNVSGDVFKRAQLAILDLNAVIANGEIGSLTSQTIQLGKALNDPIQGVSALTRVGISFNEQQKEQIKTLEQTGNLFEAQSLILDEIEGQYGGQAKILALADGGFKKLNQSIDDVSEAIGQDLVGSATEGNGALQELADGFLGVNEAIKEVNGGVGIFGSIMDGLKNIVTGGRGILDTAFNVKGMYKAAKNQYIKDMEEATKKTKAFYDTLGISVEPVKLTPITPQLDTTFGDEVLANYQKQKVEISQLQNKIGQLKKGSEERLILEKELSSILDKQKDNIKVDVDTKYIQTLLSSLDEYRNKIKLLNVELLKLGEGSSEKKVILTAELSKLQEQLDNEEIKLNLKVGKVDLEGGNIDTEGLMKEFAAETDQNIVAGLQENLNLRLQARQEYIDAVGLLNEKAFSDSQAMIDKEYESFIAAGVAQEEAQAIHDEKMKELRDAKQIQENAIVEAQLANTQVISDSLGGFAALAQQLGGEQSAAYKIFAITQATIATYLAATKALYEVPFPFNFAAAAGVVAAGLANVAQITKAHSGGEFVGTSSGIRKMAAGGSFIVPQGYPNDSYPMLVESGERVSVTPAGGVGSQDRLLSEISSKLNRLEVLNKNLISKNFSPTIVNTLEIDGRKITKSIVSTINKMEKEGRQIGNL